MTIFRRRSVSGMSDQSQIRCAFIYQTIDLLHLTVYRNPESTDTVLRNGGRQG